MSSSPLNLLDKTFAEPAQNLAADEVLAQACDAGGYEILRFWEPQTVFVVAGYANRLEREINLPACQTDSVPVLRRISGGGAVVQCPGCLNFSLVLRIPNEGPLATVSGTNEHIMDRMARALSSIVPAQVCVQGFTDLAVDGKKISGNAQRRFRNCLLFHGCILLHADLQIIGRYLNFPSKEPDYRQGRTHEDFVTNFESPLSLIKKAIIHEWNVSDTCAGFMDSHLAEIQHLVETKYSMDQWNRKF